MRFVNMSSISPKQKEKMIYTWEDDWVGKWWWSCWSRAARWRRDTARRSGTRRASTRARPWIARTGTTWIAGRAVRAGTASAGLLTDGRFSDAARSVLGSHLYKTHNTFLIFSFYILYTHIITYHSFYTLHSVV